MKTKICTTCEIEKPATNEHFYKSERGLYGLRSKCKECNSNRAKSYYLDNQEKLKEYSNTYSKENPEKIKLKKQKYDLLNKDKKSKDFKVWYYNNHEYSLQRTKDWKENNPEKYKKMIENNKESKLAYNKLYFQANKDRISERVKKWRENNPGLNTKYQQTRRHKKQNSITVYNEDIWEETMREFNHKCAYCNTDKEQLTQEHIIPVSKGGGYLRSNIIPACQSCNSSKGNKDMNIWYRKQDYFNEDNLIKINKWAAIEDGIQQISIL